MLRIRLARYGGKKKPHYRVVVIEGWRARDSRFIEVVGHYNPLSKPSEIQLNRERVEHWIKNGAQPSDTVTRLMKKSAPAEQPAA